MSAVAAAVVFGVNALLDRREDRAERSTRRPRAARQEVIPMTNVDAGLDPRRRDRRRVTTTSSP
jgi:hypothetical protein